MISAELGGKMTTKIAYGAAAVGLLALSACVTPGTKAEYQDMTGQSRGENLRQIDVAACMKDLADHRSASNFVGAVEYMTVCMQSKGWKITGWKKPDGTVSSTPFN